MKTTDILLGILVCLAVIAMGSYAGSVIMNSGSDRAAAQSERTESIKKDLRRNGYLND